MSAGPLDRLGFSCTADELFRQVCVERFGDPAAMARVLEERGFRPAPSEAAARLSNGAPGQVWRWNDAKQPLAVVTRDTGVRCQLMAPFAEVEELASQFRQTMEGLRRPGLAVEAERDDPPSWADSQGGKCSFAFTRRRAGKAAASSRCPWTYRGPAGLP